MQEEACRHTLSALHTMLRHAVHRALYGAHSTIVCLTHIVWLSPELLYLCMFICVAYPVVFNTVWRVIVHMPHIFRL